MPVKAGLYYSVTGDGQLGCPPVVLIHGAGASHLCWPVALRRLPGFRVLAIDLPGHGRSEGIAMQRIEAYADSLMELLDSLGIYRSVLVGHSMGGAVALQAARTCPAQVVALGLIASGACLNVSPQLLEYLSNPATISLALEWLRARLFGPSMSAGLAERVISQLKKARPGVLYADWQSLARFDLRAELSNFRVPIWAAVGVEDRLVPLSCARFLAANTPNVQLQLVPGAGHMLILEQPRLLGQGLCDFLAENLAR